jgi:hypothetical protein
MLPATIAIFRKLCSLQAKQKRCSDLNIKRRITDAPPNIIQAYTLKVKPFYKVPHSF